MEVFMNKNLFIFISTLEKADFSVLDGATKIESLIERCKELGMNKVAVTNHGNMINMPKIIKAGEKEGIQIIPGCELYISWNHSCHIKDKDHDERYHLVALAMNDKGYENLMRLTSEAYLVGRYKKPRIDKELLERYNEGIIFTTACLHGVLSAIAQKNTVDIESDINWLKEILDDRIYLEIQRHPDLPSQDVLNDFAISCSKTFDIPIVAACDSHYAKESHFEAWRIMMMLATGGNMGFDAVNDYYIKSQEEVARLYKDIPEAVSNTVVLANRCQPIEIKREYKFPVFNTNTLTPDEYIREEAIKGLKLRISENSIPESKTKLYFDRLEEELKIISDMGFSTYFLVVADFINWAKTNGISVGPGRGSAAGSNVCWALRITDVDSIRYGLLFERFLNPDRISMPDIDVDFQDDRRDEVKGYMSRTYGADKVASIMTVGTMAAKGAIRDVCRMLGISYQDADELAKAVPEGKRGKNVYLNTIAQEGHEDYSKEFMEKVNSKDYYKKTLEIALVLEKMTRNTGTHAAGVVVSDHEPLVKYVPLMLDKNENITTQYDMNVCEDIGLIKFDFLGLSTLTVLVNTLKNIKEIHGIDIDLEKIPLDDPKVYDLLCAGNLAGLFQLSGSSGFKDVVVGVQPRCIEEISDITSLYRPGPLDNGFVGKYIKAKNSKIIEYMVQVDQSQIQDEIEKILEPTKGVIIYQEQIMKLAQVMAGYTLAQADLLRRAMGKKKKEEMDKQREVFVSGCYNNGINNEDALKAFNIMAKFAEYGFNKSHAIAYSLITYQTAYLKTYYPVEFLSASLTDVVDKQNKTIAFINDCKKNHIQILPPSINESNLAYTPTDKGIRFGLGAIKNLGDVAVESIIKNRKKFGSFKSFIDFCKRVNLSKVNVAKIKTLIRAGCFDDLK